MTSEKVAKLSSIFRQACNVAKSSLDSFAQLADDALQILSEPDEKQVSIATGDNRAAQPERKLLNKKEIAECLNVSPRTVSNLQKEGLPVVKLRTRTLFNYEDVLLWIEENQNKPSRKTSLRVVK